MQNFEIYDGIMDALQNKLNRNEIGFFEAEMIGEYAYQVYVLESVEDEILNPIFPDFVSMNPIEFTEEVTDFLDEFDNVVTEAEYKAKSANEYLMQGYKADASHKRDINNEKDRRRLISRAYKADYAKYKAAEEKDANSNVKGKEKYIRGKIDKDANQRIAKAASGYNDTLRGLEKKNDKINQKEQAALNSLSSGNNGLSRVIKAVNPYSKENKAIKQARQEREINQSMIDNTTQNRDRRLAEVGKQSQNKYDIIMRRMKVGKSLPSSMNDKYNQTKAGYKADIRDDRCQEKENARMEKKQMMVAKNVNKQQQKQKIHDMKMAKKHGNIQDDRTVGQKIKDTLFRKAQNISYKAVKKN